MKQERRSQLTAKLRNLDRCLERIAETADRLTADYPSPSDRGDVLDLNLLRACEAVVDMANLYLASRSKSRPRSAREAFEDLHGLRVIDEATLADMRAIIGFRNLSVHQYSRVDAAIRDRVLADHLGDLRRVAERIHASAESEGG